MIKRLILFFTIAAFLFSLPSSVLADTIKLKNRGTLKGVIKEEDGAYLVLSIGTGTMRISKNEIESIERATEKENFALENESRKKSIERGTLVPPVFEELARRLREVADERKDVDSAKMKLDDMKEKFGERKDKFKSLRAYFETKNREISGVDPKENVGRYNKLVTEMNILNLNISSIVDELNEMTPKLQEYERAYWKVITDYGNDVGDFRIYLEKEAGLVKKRGLDEEEALYLDVANKSIIELEKGISKDSVEVSKYGSGMTVKTTLNDKVTCLLAVDTGAALVVISKDLADRLGVSADESLGSQHFMLADGSEVAGKVIYIKSIKVGNSVGYDVPAAIMDKPPAPGIDGLLGMSFLGNFNVKMDVANDRLILETIK